MKRAPRLIPALLRFSGAAARQDAWGRLLELNAGGAVLSTAVAMAKGETLAVFFELGGERFAVAASVDFSRRDDDGGNLVELTWRDMVERKRMARALVELLARA